MDRMFRDLRADEIDVRVAQIYKNGVKLLFYKDARVDQNILDETVGPMNWQRRHDRDNANCIVSIWDDKKQQWISKEDTGTESKTEAAKGLASDSFKRACFNWGIGRELYTAPDTAIWNNGKNVLVRIEEKNGRQICKDRFAVTELTVTDGVITHVVVYNLNLSKVVFSYTAKDEEPVARQDEEPVARQEEQIQPVTNETVKNAVTSGAELSAMAELIGDTERKVLERLAAQEYPDRPIEKVFKGWPNITKEQYAKWNIDKVKEQQRRNDLAPTDGNIANGAY